MGAWLRWWGALLASLALPVIVWSLLPSRGDLGPGRWFALAPAAGAAACVALAVRAPRAASVLLGIAALGWGAITVAALWPDEGSLLLAIVVMLYAFPVVVLATVSAAVVRPTRRGARPRGADAAQPAAD
jgi:hypothetical protein